LERRSLACCFGWANLLSALYVTKVSDLNSYLRSVFCVGLDQ
jgi:hypothetical protein